MKKQINFWHEVRIGLWYLCILVLLFTKCHGDIAILAP